MEAAASVFVNKGYERATMQDIVDASGMSRGGVYMYFSSTEEVFIALFEERNKENIAGYLHLYDQTSTSWEAVKLFIQLAVDDLKTSNEGMYPVYYEFFIMSWREKKHKELIEERYHQVVNSTVHFLNEGVRRGDFSPKAPVDVIARVVLSFVEGVLIGTLSVREQSVQLEQQVELMLSFLKDILQIQDQ
jgi:AcrR family transcriptional regulator